MAHPDAEGGDLVLAAAAAGDPDADPAVAPLAPDVEAGEGADDPFLEVVDEAAQVRSAPLQVEHDIGHPLARARDRCTGRRARWGRPGSGRAAADRRSRALVPAV